MVNPLLENLPIILDGRPVDKITAFLFPKGGNDDPYVLLANQGKSFQGSIVLGMGFTFDDSNPDATPIAEMHRLIEKDPRNAERIFPYIGGEEVNSSPTHDHHHYVINFGEMSEEELRQWPELVAIVEEKVKPERLSQKDKGGKSFWWRFLRPRGELQRAIASCDRVLVIPRVVQTGAFTFLPNRMVYSEQLIIISLSSFSAFASLQSRIHEIFARFLGSSMKDDLRYTPSSCFEAFPFPENWETHPILENIGKIYYEFRAALMVRNNQGLTDTYNRFHDPEEQDTDILKLRDLHEQMDRAVLNAYGWPDIDTTCGFALDYLDTDPEDLAPAAQDRILSGDLFFPTADEATAFDSLVRTGNRKLPWHYRWPETTHDEVLARLLILNQQRYEEEVRGGLHSKKKTRKAKTKPKSKKPQSKATETTQQLNLIPPPT